jgi:hypothetical protein
MMVVQTNDASFFQVEPVDGIDPARLGVGVKQTKDGFVPNTGKRKR